MPPIDLNDDEMNAVTALAAALPRQLRDAFLRTVAANVAGLPAGARGAGSVHRIAAATQKEFLQTDPIAVGARGKHGR